MWKVLIKSIREYKKPSLLAPAYVSLEVVIECIIPFITAQLVNQIKAGCGIEVILKYGLLLLVMANPAIRFRFVYQVGKEAFLFDTDALREQGIDLQHPQMLTPVKRYIRENLEVLWRHRAPESYLC